VFNLALTCAFAAPSIIPIAASEVTTSAVGCQCPRYLPAAPTDYYGPVTAQIGIRSAKADARLSPSGTV
jgi:hypothetical protein